MVVSRGVSSGRTPHAVRATTVKATPFPCALRRSGMASTPNVEVYAPSGTACGGAELAESPEGASFWLTSNLDTSVTTMEAAPAPGPGGRAS